MEKLNGKAAATFGMLRSTLNGREMLHTDEGNFEKKEFY